jgi:hypothetical protein
LTFLLKNTYVLYVYRYLLTCMHKIENSRIALLKFVENIFLGSDSASKSMSL